MFHIRSYRYIIILHQFLLLPVTYRARRQTTRIHDNVILSFTIFFFIFCSTKGFTAIHEIKKKKMFYSAIFLISVSYNSIRIVLCMFRAVIFFFFIFFIHIIYIITRGFISNRFSFFFLFQGFTHKKRTRCKIYNNTPTIRVCNLLFKIELKWKNLRAPRFISLVRLIRFPDVNTDPYYRGGGYGGERVTVALSSHLCAYARFFFFLLIEQLYSKIVIVCTSIDRYFTMKI